MHNIPLLFGAFGLLAPIADAHMVLGNPPAFPASGNPQNNGPLLANYPCKQAGSSTYQFDFPRTQMALGSKQNVSFIGSAVHGGGSCQLSLSKDLEPTAQSVFKVIHSIEGGCPARNTPGNFPADSDTYKDPDIYDYTIPSDLEPGQYTFAWTWANKIGNREFYMSCAPIEITGGSSKRDIEARDSAAFDNLPNTFLFNIDNVQCHTQDSMDLQYPDPGSSLETNDPKLAPPTGPVDTCYAGGKNTGALVSGTPSSGASSAGNTAAPAASSSAAASPAAPPSSATSDAAPYPSPGAPSGNAAPSSGGSSGYTPPSNPAPVSGSSSCPTGSQSCSSMGGVVCIGTSQFGLCDQTGCAIAQPLAAGTVCSGGKITRRSMRIDQMARRSD